MIIAIDGPTASGKSTIARELAKQLNMYYLNTGLLYRALAYILINHYGYELAKLNVPEQHHVAQALDPASFLYTYASDSGEHIFFQQNEITGFLRDSLMDAGSSIVSLNPMVRDYLLIVQRNLAAQHDVVADGRDVGSVVFANADFKFFMTASLDVRAHRWQVLQANLGKQFTLEQAKEMIDERDKRDSERAIAPLIMPEDAIRIDNSHMTKSVIMEHILDFISKKKWSCAA